MLVAAALASLDSDAAFTQISGLGVQLNVNQVRSGGNNNEVFHLPGGVNQGSLTLKRGLATITSPLLLWCFGTASGALTIAPKTIVVTLMDKNPNNDAWYTLHCSTRELYLPIDLIQDLKLFCQQIARIKQMQTDYVNSK